MFVTRRLRRAKPQDKGAQGPADRPNPMAGRPDFELVQAETWWLRSHVGSEEDTMPESQWHPRGVADWPRGWPPNCPSPPNRLN
jgi:hypothetical protein